MQPWFQHSSVLVAWFCHLSKSLRVHGIKAKFSQTYGREKSNQTCLQLHTWETGESINTQCCCLSQPRSQNQGLSYCAVPQARRESRTQKSWVLGSVLRSSSIQDPHGCPSSPLWFNVSLSCVHSQSGPVSCLFCSFYCTWIRTASHLHSPSSSAAWSFGLPYPSVPSSNWVKSVGHEAALEVRCANTQKYPKDIGIYPVIPQPYVLLPLKRLNCLLFTLFSSSFCQIRRRHFHNPYSSTHGLGFVLRQNKRNNSFQVVHSEVLESRQLGLKLTKENDFTSQLKRANGTKCNGRMTQLKTKQRRAIFHNNADVKILKIFLACTREHKKEKKTYWE